MVRSTVLALCGLAVFPAAAAAQFTPAIVPPNPLYQHPAYQYQFNVGVSVPTAFGRTFVGGTVPFTRAPQFFSPNYGQRPVYPWTGSGVPSSGYMTGSIGRYDSYSVQRDFEKAQREAALIWGNPDAAKNLISNQWAYEKVGLVPAAGGAAKPAVEALADALRASTEAEVASGEALNQILVAIVTAEAKGAKGVSAFLPPQVLGEIRFAGASGDSLNLLRQAGRLPFPGAFDAPELAELRDALRRDFSAAAAPLLAGKTHDVTKLAALERTLKQTESAAPAVIRDLSFEDAIAARKFLNQLAGTVRTIKTGGAAGLVNPAWTTEGTNVADLVRHMTKFKIRFGPAAEGGETAYLALHRGMTTYLFVLTQPKK
jgi:hypothetical protein